MIFKFTIVCALIALTASGSAIKGREEGALKGGLKSPIERLSEYRQAAVKTSKLDSNAGLDEAREQYQKKEELPLAAEHRNEENWRETQQREEGELKGAPIRYEAKQQLSRDELSKVNNKLEQREESKTNRFEQKQEDKFEQYSQQREIKLENHGQQVVELREEQRRVVDEQPALIQPILPLAVEEEPIRAELQSVKGGSFVAQQAPIGEAEPYAFSYNIDGSSRSESGDTKGVVRGQYTLSGPDGSNRVVEYIADQNGFRASVNTNEFGTEAKSPASIALRTSQPLAEEITLRSEGKTVESSKSAPLVAQKPLLFEDSQQVLYEGQKKESNIREEQLVPIAEARKTLLEQAPIAQSQLNLNDQGGRKGSLEEIKREPIKGLKEQQRSEELPVRKIENYPAKSAEVRSPKTYLASEYKYAAPNVQQRAGFESATAHRVYRQPVNYVSQPLPLSTPVRPPGVLVRAHPPAPVVRGPVPVSVVSRPSHQYERYPPSPVQGYRRSHHRYEPAPSNPRVSFYGSNLDEDHASFEHLDS